MLDNKVEEIKMADVKIILPDGSAKEYAAGTTLGEAVKQLSNSLAKKVLAANVNGELTDLREELVDGSEVAFLTFEEDGGKHTLRHTASHILAQAVKRLWPEAKLAIGPAIDKGFYYDIDMEHTLTPEDLGKIEKEMSRIVKENLPITKSVMSRQEAIEFFKSKNEDYKVELIQDLPEDAVISCYAQGDFIDLCAGPHVASTGGLALGAISTRSRCFSSANANASRPDIMPICSFSGPTTRSSRARISSLMRGVSLLIAFTSKRIKKTDGKHHPNRVLYINLILHGIR